MADRASYTFRVHRLSYPELWRLANRRPLAFLVLLQVKLFKITRFDRTDTSSFRVELRVDATPPEHLREDLRLAREHYAALGFRYLGLDAELLRVKGCGAHFARGPVIGIRIISARLNFDSLSSYPADRLPVVTANGRGYIDNTSLYDALLRPRMKLPDLLACHLGRLASLGLADLSDTAVCDALEQMARKARALQIARGVFVEQQLVPPLLPAQKS